MYVKEVGCDEVNWIRVAQRPVVGSCEQSNETSDSIKESEFLD
jgi:hypothetical protein